MTDLYNGRYGLWTAPRNYTKPDGTVYRTAIYGGDRSGEVCTVNLTHPNAAANAQLIHSAPYVLNAMELVLAGLIKQRTRKDFDLDPFYRLANIAQAMARGHEEAEAAFPDVFKEAEAALNI